MPFWNSIPFYLLASADLPPGGNQFHIQFTGQTYSHSQQKSKRAKREKGIDFKSEFARIHSSQISMESVC